MACVGASSGVVAWTAIYPLDAALGTCTVGAPQGLVLRKDLALLKALHREGRCSEGWVSPCERRLWPGWSSPCTINADKIRSM